MLVLATTFLVLSVTPLLVAYSLLATLPARLLVLSVTVLAGLLVSRLGLAVLSLQRRPLVSFCGVTDAARTGLLVVDALLVFLQLFVLVVTAILVAHG